MSENNTELKLAKAILNEAKAHEVIEGELPEDEKKLIKLSEQLVKAARKAYDKGERGDHVTSILNLADSVSNDSDSEEVEPEPDTPEKIYQRAVRESIENLPIPVEIDEDAIPDMPIDLAELSDKELMRFHGIFNACSARANWLVAVEESGKSAAKTIADNMEDEYIVNLGEARKDFGGKSKTQALLKAEAESKNSELKRWRQLQRKHEREENKIRRLAEIYDNYCERLSRQWTYRIEERKHA